MRQLLNFLLGFTFTSALILLLSIHAKAETKCNASSAKLSAADIDGRFDSLPKRLSNLKTKKEKITLLESERQIMECELRRPSKDPMNDPSRNSAAKIEVLLITALNTPCATMDAQMTFNQRVGDTPVDQNSIGHQVGRALCKEK